MIEAGCCRREVLSTCRWSAGRVRVLRRYKEWLKSGWKNMYVIAGLEVDFDGFAFLD
jgi:hypothetical protein